jgi:hypothetical protein
MTHIFNMEDRAPSASASGMEILLRTIEGGFTDCDLSGEIMISGGLHSLAASLDYAIDKQPVWLREMFGSDSHGTPIMKRLLIRSNSGRKRSGPVAIAMNTGFLSVESNRFFLDGQEIRASLNLIDVIETLQWTTQYESSLATRAARGVA